MSIKALKEYTRFSKYAKYNPELKRRETWDEQISRVFDMHVKKYGVDLISTIQDDFDFAKEMVKKKYVLGSQRGLQFGGDPILIKNEKIYNCSSSYCDRPRFFQECMFLLLCGCGTGFSVQKHHVAKLPNIVFPTKKDLIFKPTDDIEGWSDCIGVILSSYFDSDLTPFPEYRGHKVKFDFSDIRPKGAPISSGSKAPGPEPLRIALLRIDDLLERRARQKDKLDPIDAYDIIMHSSDAVLSGGIRRCIAKGQKVLEKNNSFKNVEDIQVGDLVSTDNGWKPVKNIFKQGVQKTLKIIHQDGALRCTANHKIAILKDFRGNFEWKMAKDLNSNDVLFFKDNCNDINKIEPLPTFNYDFPLHSTTCKNITIPDMDEDIAWLLGEIHCDGYIYLDSKSGQVVVSVEGTNPDKAVKIQNIIERFGVNSRITYPNETDNSYKVCVKSKQLATYFSQWLKKPKTAINIPECIKKSTDNIKIAYIQGVLDADGSIGSRCQQIVSSIYKDFVSQLQALLWSVGIVSRMKKCSSNGLKDNWKEKYSLYLVNNDDRIKFNEMVSVGYKKFNKSLCQRNSNSYPMEFIKSLKSLPKSFHKKVAINSSNIAYSTYNNLFEYNYIKPIRVIDVVYDDLEVDTYDIEVEDNHNFICEGILVHNSASIALFSHDDEQMMNAKTGSWFVENKQRGRSNNSVVLIRDKTSKEDFENIIGRVREYGEPGFIWSDDSEFLVNPCVTDETWITCKSGIYQVKDLINSSKPVYVDGKEYDMTSNGFIKTGTKDVYKINTKEGFEVEATSNHKFMDDNGNWKELKDFKNGDKIKLHHHNDINWDGNGTSEEGWLLGSLLGDGTFMHNSAVLDYWGENRHAMKELAIQYIKESKLETYQDIRGSEQIAKVGKVRIESVKLNELAERFGIYRSKEISDSIEKGSSDFYSGFLRGYFDADGGVYGNLKKGVSVRATSVSENNLIRIQRMLLRMGIYSTIYKNRRDEGYRLLPDGKGGEKEYWCKSLHELVITKESILTYVKRIGFSDENKSTKLKETLSGYKRDSYKTNFVATIKSIDKIGEKDVYDCSVDIVHAFDANGFYAHNCAEIGFFAKILIDDKNKNDYLDEIKIQQNEKELSGWAFCNLCEINMKRSNTEEDFLNSCRAASIIGTLQAGYDKFDYLGKVSEDICKREALLGVSMTGMADSPEIAFDPKMQKKGVKVIKEYNEKIAAKLGINPGARLTCVKPAGCQNHNTLTNTDKGLLYLNEVGDIHGSEWQPHQILVDTDTGFAQSNNFFVNGFSPTTVIGLDSGLFMESTDNHKYRVIDENGEYVWKNACEISVGDVLPYKLGNNNVNSYQKLINVDINLSSFATRKKDILQPNILNEDIAFFLGMYYGDGSNHKRSIRIHGSSQRKGFDFISEIIQSNFGIYTKECADKREGDRLHLSINSKEFVEFLKANGLLKKRSYDIEIPLLIRKSPQTVIESFIKGFNTADGNCDNNSGPSYCTTSYKFAKELTVLLRSIGRDCKIIFCPPNESSKGNRMRYIVQERKGRKGNLIKVTNYRKKYYEILEDLGMEDFSVDMVTDCFDSSSYTVDIEVPEGNTYISNSYISHNTTSCILGTASGIHPHHAKRYIRRVQANKMEIPLNYFRKFNPLAVEQSVWGDQDDIISFLCEVPDGAKTKNNMNAIALLENVKLTQQNWVEGGTCLDRCAMPWIRHNVSNTINIKPEEWDEVSQYIYRNRKWFTGISMLPVSGDKDYPQAPFTAIYTPAEIVREYGDGSIMASGLIVDGLRAFDNNLWAACDCALGIGEIIDVKLLKSKIKRDFETNGSYWKKAGLSPETPDELLNAYLSMTVTDYILKKDWVRRANKFSNRYFDNDVRKMTYCLKDVYNWKNWCDLKREYVDIDWEKCIEEEGSLLNEEVDMACGGGACDLGDLGVVIREQKEKQNKTVKV